jgi:hypothetical protein
MMECAHTQLDEPAFLIHTSALQESSDKGGP